jgi:hypothetical protein
MKKGFCNGIKSVILICMLTVVALPQTGVTGAERAERKEKMLIVVVEKKGREKSGSSGESQKPRPEAKDVKL